MAITKPSIYKISAFDVGDLENPSNSPDIFFAVTGLSSYSEVSSTAMVQIYNNDDNTSLISNGVNTIITYEPDLSSNYLYVYSFKISNDFTNLTYTTTPMENGKAYNITITISDLLSPVTSLTSNGLVFYCYTQPYFSYTNIPTSPLPQTSFNVRFNYIQPEGELLNWYKCDLYQVSSPNDILVASGVTLYDSNYSYTFSGLVNNNSYYIVTYGSTVNETEFNNTSNTFSINISEYANSPFIVLQNVCDDGYISVQSLVAPIIGVPTPSNISPSGGEIDLTTDGYNVLWKEGFGISGNFTIQLWGKNFILWKIISALYNNDAEKIELQYIEDFDNPTTKVRFGLYVYYNTQYPYYLESNAIDIPNSGDQLYIGIQKVDGLFNINLINLG